MCECLKARRRLACLKDGEVECGWRVEGEKGRTGDEVAQGGRGEVIQGL